MAVVTNTFQSTQAVGNREELSDVVSRITPEDTPIYSLIEKGRCVTVHPEWETDELVAPGANIREEGEEYAFGAIAPPKRLGNYTQIMRKDWIISATQEVVSEAGNVQKRKYQKLKKGVEIRKDVEFAIADTNASAGGATREFGSLNTWIETNVSRGATGANGGFNPGTGLTVAPVTGTQRAFTKAILDDVMQQGYQNGANFRHVSVSPYVKSVFVTFMSDANVAPFRYAVSQGGERNTIVATADYYEGPFGTVMIHPNRVQAVSTGLARNAFFIDTDMLSFLWLRNIQEDRDVAKTGDADKGVIIGEGTLKVHNEKGLGIAADLFGLSAAS
ncbi:DUF5309 domain-containing protein [Sinorhizobium alkalisoli]|uniref:DUF5309 domain-containing protein n=1 Tax=Sinorhizobium alkalisoli TaxID=1752398 RepID=UPI00124C1C15|nr:DUF5309 domain-containing protein [Sinorhizobium alkalisoli]MCA1491846.1 DUF5309 domain-containing protein [Ensifer sp. NBAIM29]QFI66850.1 Phage capsid and scaffold [Sinorhizobium alkalisoli]